VHRSACPAWRRSLVVPGIVRLRTGVGKWRQDGFGLDLVAAAEWAGPDEGAGAGWWRVQPAWPLRCGRDGRAVPGRRRRSGRRPGTRRCGPGRSGRGDGGIRRRRRCGRGSGCGGAARRGAAGRRGGVEVAPVAFAVPAGDVGQHPAHCATPARRRGAAGELGEKRCGQCSSTIPPARPGGGEPGGPRRVMPSNSSRPPASVMAQRHSARRWPRRRRGRWVAGSGRGRRSRRVLVVAEQGGQRHPHLHADALVVAHGGSAAVTGPHLGRALVVRHAVARQHVEVAPPVSVALAPSWRRVGRRLT
jgi:hypothetical protein